MQSLELGSVSSSALSSEILLSQPTSLTTKSSLQLEANSRVACSLSGLGLGSREEGQARAPTRLLTQWPWLWLRKEFPLGYKLGHRPRSLTEMSPRAPAAPASLLYSCFREEILVFALSIKANQENSPSFLLGLRWGVLGDLEGLQDSLSFQG